MDLPENLIPALAGLVSGAIGSLIAPWVHWGIDARRERMKNRKELIQAARSLLVDPPELEAFRRLPIYFQLKPHLSVKTNKTVAGEFDALGQELEVIVDGPYGGVNPYAHEILEDLARKEKEWGLV